MRFKREPTQVEIDRSGVSSRLSERRACPCACAHTHTGTPHTRETKSTRTCTCTHRARSTHAVTGARTPHA